MIYGECMLLVNPATEQFGGFLSRYIPLGLPIAIGTLAAYLQKYGHQVNIANDEIEKLDENNIENYLEGLPQPYVFGLTVLTSQAHRAYAITRMLKTKYPDSIVIMGGIHVTALPEEGIGKGADIVVRGEGEITLRHLYETIREGKDWQHILGITYKNEKGDVCSTEDALLIRDLDEIPIFPYHLFENAKYDMGVITGARGCPYKCSYCSQRLITGLTYRWHSTERVIETLDILINKYGLEYVGFYDDNFSVNRRRVKELSDGIVAAGFHQKAKFAIQTRADNLYPEIMPYLKRANFAGIGFGMETASERLAKVIVKDQTVKTHTKAIKLGREWGMDISVFLIFGLPTETTEDRRLSVEYTNKMDLRFTKFNNLIPYPGTKLYNEIKGTHQVHIEKEWSNFNSTLTATRSIFNTTPLPYVPEGTHPWQLKQDIVKANLGFYFQPRSIIDFLLRRGSGANAKLPQGWFKKPREVYEVARLGVILLSNYLVALLPFHVGLSLYRMVTGDRLEERSGEEIFTNPDAIDGTMRKMKFDTETIRKKVYGSQRIANPNNQECFVNERKREGSTESETSPSVIAT